MRTERTWISIGDITDLKNKIQQKGVSDLLSKLRFSGNKRSFTKWDNVVPGSDFWIIPEIRRRWNEKCTGSPEIAYEDYLTDKYFRSASDLRMLSVGCGTGSRERNFGKHKNFVLIEGIDIASSKISEAAKIALTEGLGNIRYHADDFRTYDFEPDTYDIILFNSSLHHFNNIDRLLKERVLPLLKRDGYLVIFDYVGPRRLQWSGKQLEYANNLLKELPERYKTRQNGKSIKKRIYRPGLLRMYMVDPSEAVESDRILPAIHKYFTTIEEKQVGWDILHLLLKEISHNFLSDDPETRSLLSYLFEQEDNYMKETGRSDAVFGVYRKYD
jgi:ubiquinone/menaquinone biosynthesis C-methylase UbiE